MSKPEVTHADLVESASRWLRKEHYVVITEMSTNWGEGEKPDAIGWKGGSFTTLIECKTSRQDFLADRKKFHRKGIGIGTYRYYLVLEGVAYPFELPPFWGLLEFKNKRQHPRLIRKAHVQAIKNWHGEMSILCSALRRIGGLRNEGISVKMYQWETKKTATLGIKKEQSDES